MMQIFRSLSIGWRVNAVRTIHCLPCLFRSLRLSSSIANYVAELEARDLVFSSYPSNLYSKFATELNSLPPVIYAGFDPTSESLHIGNLLVILNLLRSARFGILPIAVVGGATAAVGDPSGRSSERKVQAKDVILHNTRLLIAQLKRIARNLLVDDFVVVDNNTWFKEMSVVDYLRNCKRLHIGEMLRTGAVKSRLSDQCGGISFTEFSYQTMQAIDWFMLLEKYDCRFQIGGSDQLGHLNIGAHYIKRICGGKFAAGICLPLVTDNAGKKLGKSQDGDHIWLSADLTSPFHFYQFFRQLHDDVAELLYKRYSLDPWEDVVIKVDEHRSNLGKWVVQDALAHELTRIVHGKEGLDIAQRCSRILFEASMSEVKLLSRAELLRLFTNTIKIARDEVRTFGDLADRTKSGKIKGSILMGEGAFKVNGEKVINSAEPLVLQRICLPETQDLTLICWGKRKFSLVQWI
ncbi:tyrosine--tRNA ligase [Dictyocaulus viviparus]|uniref:Tyrosine--tRNA ligase n=1 Tax=Dictyocaulus viviparus TaxID=29172 RepID=A0A0D8XZT8_DICVI|nr:tyrosine--tRNA ligase [Dictyocaulus viviparus]